MTKINVLAWVPTTMIVQDGATIMYHPHDRGGGDRSPLWTRPQRRVARYHDRAVCTRLHFTPAFCTSLHLDNSLVAASPATNCQRLTALGGASAFEYSCMRTYML
jgi:hypothetical protein